MKDFPQILPQFTEIQLAKKDALDVKTGCAYLLEAGDSISAFIEKIGRHYEERGEEFNLYNFYAAYNLQFPTTPATVSLMAGRRLVALGIKDFEELLQKISENAKSGAQLAVFLSIQERTPDEMLTLKRDIFQQFIYLRMYLPIIVDVTYKAALKTLGEILSDKEEKTEITFIGTKKSGKSSLINAVLGAEYTPASSELPTPNKVSYAWSGADDGAIRVESGSEIKTFSSSDELREHLANEFRRANEKSSALKPMQVYLPKFPENLRDFVIVDTPGPNFAAAKEHTTVTQNTLKDMNHCIFVMNYSAHLTNDEIALFDSAYKALNNKRRHQTLIVAVNRIDEMYAADVIKSYERFADYIRHRLNALGYENIVVVSISAITAVYIEKIRELSGSDENLPLDNQLKNLRRKYKGTEQSTIISFVEKALDDVLDFHGMEIETLEDLKDTSRVGYLVKMSQSMFDPAEQFEWIDETFEDVFEESFESDEEFFQRVMGFAEEGDADAMNFVGIMYSIGKGVAQNVYAAVKWYMKSADAGNPDGMGNVAYCYLHGDGVKQNIYKAAAWAALPTATAMVMALKKIRRKL